MQANYFEAEFSSIISKFRKRKKLSSSLVNVLHKTWNWAFSRRSRAATPKKCTKKHAAREELLFCLFNLFLFWRSRCRRRCGILKFLIAHLNTPETPRFLHRSITVYYLTTWGSIKLLIYNNLVQEKRFKSTVILATIWTHVGWKNDYFKKNEDFQLYILSLHNSG